VQQPPATTSLKKAKLTALRMLAVRRLTEAQLWTKLERKGYDGAAIGGAVEACKAAGYVDDALFAELYVHAKGKPVGDQRLVAELVRRGVDREIAARKVADSEASQEARASAALEKIVRTKPATSYPTAARALERLGFPASLIYRVLREHAQQHGPLAQLQEVLAAENAN
jgi:regulatory protein